MEALMRLGEELMAHPERDDDQAQAWHQLSDQAHQLDLHEGLVQSEGCEDGAAAALHRPAHDRAAMRRAFRIDVGEVDVEPIGLGELHLAAQEIEIGIVGAHAGTGFRLLRLGVRPNARSRRFWFSMWLTISRWSGLTHSRLRQRWSICLLRGT